MPRKLAKSAASLATNATAKPLNRGRHAAKAVKQDEFYTKVSDIEIELGHAVSATVWGKLCTKRDVSG